MSEWERYYELVGEARSLDHGIARFEIRRQAATVADQIGDPDTIFEAQTHLAHDALKAAKFEDAFFAFVKFATMYDEAPERFENYRNFVMYFYGWSIGHMCFYASVSKAQIDSTLAAYERRLNELGHGLGQLWMSKIEVGQHLGADDSAMEEWYARYQEERRGIPEYCEGCWLNFDVRYRNYRDEYDRMIAEALPAFDGRKTCDSAPHVTYSYVVLPAFIAGEARADAWFKAGYDLVKNEVGHISTVNRHFGYVVASNQIDVAVKIFENHASQAIDDRDDYDRLSFSIPAQGLFEKLRERGASVRVKTPSSWAHHDADHSYDVDRLIDIFTKESEETAAAFDKRNQNSVVSDRRTRLLREMRGDG